MTEVVFRYGRSRQKRTRWAELDVRGHAADTETCNYVVGIVFALAGYLENAKLDGQVRFVEVSIDREPPDARLRAWDMDERAEACFRMALIGLLRLEKTRPEAIAVEVVDASES